jgi:hypothetical protein
MAYQWTGTSKSDYVFVCADLCRFSAAATLLCDYDFQGYSLNVSFSSSALAHAALLVV